MPDYTNWAIANQAVMNPATSAADLTQIANAQPSLRAAVAAHPSAHPQLLDWLAHQGDPAVAAAVAARQAGYSIPAAPAFAPIPTPAPGYAPAPCYAPAPAYASAPGYAPMPAPAAKGPNRNMMIGLILGGVALIVAIALILVFAVFQPGGNSASPKVDAPQTSYTQAQTALPSVPSDDSAPPTTAPPTTAPPTCDTPSGVNPMVCSGPPSTTVLIPMTYWGGGDIGTQMFMSPSNGVGCMNFADRVECDADGATWQMPAPLLQTSICIESQNCGSQAVALMADGSITAWPRSDVPDYLAARAEGVDVPLMGNGQVTMFGYVACLVEETGVTCWDTTTQHGFKISSSSLLYW